MTSSQIVVEAFARFVYDKSQFASLTIGIMEYWSDGFKRVFDNLNCFFPLLPPNIPAFQYSIFASGFHKQIAVKRHIISIGCKNYETFKYGRLQKKISADLSGNRGPFF
jgi:hypothetical protein